MKRFPCKKAHKFSSKRDVWRLSYRSISMFSLVETDSFIVTRQAIMFHEDSKICNGTFYKSNKFVSRSTKISAKNIKFSNTCGT
jgi:hypothetical protein